MPSANETGTWARRWCRCCNTWHRDWGIRTEQKIKKNWQKNRANKKRSCLLFYLASRERGVTRPPPVVSSSADSESLDSSILCIVFYCSDKLNRNKPWTGTRRLRRWTLLSDARDDLPTLLLLPLLLIALLLLLSESSDCDNTLLFDDAFGLTFDDDDDAAVGGVRDRWMVNGDLGAESDKSTSRCVD